MSLLSLKSLTVYRGECPVVDHISFDVAPGDFIGLIGPNGAGKTTLMRAALGLIPHQGQSNIASLSPQMRAKSAAWLPQHREIAWGLSVYDVVALGRAGAREATSITQGYVEHALSRVGMETFAQRNATHLSGGEQARVLIARAIAQDTPLLMADEPTASLDPANQISTMETFVDIARQGRAVMASIHDLGLAARYCTKLALIARGQILAFGTVSDVLTPDNLAQAFHIATFHQETPDGVIFQPTRILPYD